MPLLEFPNCPEALPSENLEGLWLDEASRRASQLDAGDVTLVSAEEVDRKARALLGCYRLPWDDMCLHVGAGR